MKGETDSPWHTQVYLQASAMDTRELWKKSTAESLLLELIEMLPVNLQDLEPFDQMTVFRLKQLLKLAGLRVSGNKPELRKRLEEFYEEYAPIEPNSNGTYYNFFIKATHMHGFYNYA